MRVRKDFDVSPAQGALAAWSMAAIFQSPAGVRA
jgi:hypothetical protein